MNPSLLLFITFFSSCLASLLPPLSFGLPCHLGCPAIHVLWHRLLSTPIIAEGNIPRSCASVHHNQTVKWQHTLFVMFCPVVSSLSLSTPSSTFFPSSTGLYPATFSFNPSSSFPLPRTLNNCVHPPFPSLLFFLSLLILSTLISSASWCTERKFP
ncbi:MAG: hypothetical protein JOS17DRAFT_347001 [Linnemannia elongata]|nr:MAG: hypothetical protein JOS17DRAFT_347001 [Linnemannia elongata]